MHCRFKTDQKKKKKNNVDAWKIDKMDFITNNFVEFNLRTVNIVKHIKRQTHNKNKHCHFFQRKKEEKQKPLYTERKSEKD